METSLYAKFGPSSASTLRSEGANLAETKALNRMFIVHAARNMHMHRPENDINDGYSMDRF